MEIENNSSQGLFTYQKVLLSLFFIIGIEMQASVMSFTVSLHAVWLTG